MRYHVSAAAYPPSPAAPLPGLLAGRRHQIVDDVRRDQNQQITPVLLLGRESEQLAQNRQIYKERNSGLRYRDLSHRKSANYGRFAIVDQDLIVRLLRLERESDVDGRRAHIGPLGVHFHQDLARACDVWRDPEIDTGLLELHGRTRYRRGCASRTDRTDVDNANRYAVTDEDFGLPVVERRDGRLGLNVREVDALQRLHERREVEVADRGRENELERGIHHFLPGVAERRERIPTERDDVLVGREVRRGHQRIGHAVQVGVHGLGGARIGTLHEPVEELRPGAEVVFDSQLFDVGAID